MMVIETRRSPFAGIGYTRSLYWLPAVASSKPGSTRRRRMSSKISCPLGLDTGTASRNAPLTSKANPTTVWPSSNGNCSSPSSTLALGLNSLISKVVCACPANNSARMLTWRNSMGCTPGVPTDIVGGFHWAVVGGFHGGAIAGLNA